MTEITTLNNTNTPSGTEGQYKRAQALLVGAGDQQSSSETQSQVPSEYLRAYRAADKSIRVCYNLAEINARSVRRQISRILGD